MKPTIVAAGIVAILAFDVIASIASKTLGFAYARASIGSYLVYLILGIVAARTAGRHPFAVAAGTAAIVGFIEASIGWWLAWQIGPGRPASDFTLTPTMWLSVAIIVTGSAALIGAVGGVIARLFQGAAPPS